MLVTREARSKEEADEIANRFEKHGFSKVEIFCVPSGWTIHGYAIRKELATFSSEEAHIEKKNKKNKK